jgi:hypothetical protein
MACHDHTGPPADCISRRGLDDLASSLMGYRPPTNNRIISGTHRVALYSKMLNIIAKPWSIESLNYQELPGLCNTINHIDIFL